MLGKRFGGIFGVISADWMSVDSATQLGPEEWAWNQKLGNQPILHPHINGPAMGSE
jgi:hypothetical protein